MADADGMIALRPVGRVQGGRVVPEDDGWDTSHAVIELDAERFTPAALQGLDAFSHVEVVFVFNQVAEGDVTLGARRPRGRPYGTFTSRAGSADQASNCSGVAFPSMSRRWKAVT